MTSNALVQLTGYLVLLLGVALPLGAYLARVFSGEAKLAQTLLGPLERGLYRTAGVDPRQEMTWTRYAAAVVLFNLFGTLLLYTLQRLQNHLPLNPAGLGAVPPTLAFNTAVSFVTNTNWQAYAGESTLSPLTQVLGLTVQNFLSAATGLSVLVALLRGLYRADADTLGNFWVDLCRSTLYVLLPLSLVFALVLVSQGVVQALAPAVHATLAAPVTLGDGTLLKEQIIPLGPVASQVAIKQLGTNGGGYFNANGAHPFENPTPFSNLLQLVAILLLPAAQCFMAGALVKDRRQGVVLLAAMVLVFVPLAAATIALEQGGSPILRGLALDLSASDLSAGGNLEGKELRFGVVGSALWATATTAASNGAVNAMHDSFTPLGGLIPLWLIQLGEVIFGGVGSGLYGMLIFAILAVFIAGLMVGRTPEYLGKKIEPFEMKMAALVLLFPSAAVLVGTAVACLVPDARAALGNPGAHGFSELLYAFSSAANNNGSAFGGLSANSPFFNVATGLCMFIGRFLVIIPVLALAGALGRKRRTPVTAGTLPTHTPLFVLLLIGTVLLVGALTFVPALALGPVAEHLAR